MSKVDLRLGDNLEILKSIPDNSIDSLVCDPPYGIKFMGKKWDYEIPSVELWEEALRVLKSGGHALVACGTRTQHRMAVNLEDAGFEIRDIVAWIYGSGYPKGLDIAKAIDKKEGYWRGRAGKVVSDNTSMSGGNYERTDKGEPITDNAKKYEGWRTALKPAMELWTLVRKPLEEKTVAENVMKYGTGGINIDGCRIEINPEIDDSRLGGNGSWKTDKAAKNVYEGGYEGIDIQSNPQGRFPANLIHDGSDEVKECFPNTKSGKMTSKHKRHTDGSPNGIYGKFDVNHPLKETIGDSGNASRFFKSCEYSENELEEYQSIFYCPKASKKERSCDGKVKNNHPTVKPISLMQYLCRLITPPNGIVLDPYMGSGSTGIACKLEGFNFIGIEREKDYFEIASERINIYKGDNIE